MAEEEVKNAEQNVEATDAVPKKRAPRKKAAPLAAEQPAAEGAPAIMSDVEPAPAGEPRRRRPAQKVVNVNEQLVFGKFSPKDVVVRDQSISAYITFGSRAFPNIYGRRKNMTYYTTHITIIERLMNKLMRGGTGKKVGGKVIRTEGRLQGKKLKVMHVVEHAFDSIQKNTGKNPLQVLVDALQNSAPVEDTTRVRYGGISYNVAVGISAERRLNVALRNVALAALVGAFKSRRSLSDALASELVLAANKDPNSYAVKKKVELERIARSAR